MAESFAQGAGIAGAQLLGDLARGAARWEVYLETALAPDGAAVRGRLHFVQADRRRESAWIFLEHSDREVRERVADFSSSELWAILESLAP